MDQPLTRARAQGFCANVECLKPLRTKPKKRKSRSDAMFCSQACQKKHWRAQNGRKSLVGNQSLTGRYRVHISENAIPLRRRKSVRDIRETCPSYEVARRTFKVNVSREAYVTLCNKWLEGGRKELAIRRGLAPEWDDANPVYTHDPREAAE